jgi:hypothetical protein
MRPSIVLWVVSGARQVRDHVVIAVLYVLAGDEVKTSPQLQDVGIEVVEEE